MKPFPLCPDCTSDDFCHFHRVTRSLGAQTLQKVSDAHIRAVRARTAWSLVEVWLERHGRHREALSASQRVYGYERAAYRLAEFARMIQGAI